MKKTLVCMNTVRPEAGGLQRANTTEAHTIRERLNFLFGSPHHRPHGIIGHLSAVCTHARNDTTRYIEAENCDVWVWAGLSFFWNRELARSFELARVTVVGPFISLPNSLPIFVKKKLFANLVQVAPRPSRTDVRVPLAGTS